MHRINLTSNTRWEPIVGYSRAVRIGETIHVTGTTATLPGGGQLADANAYAQAQQALRNIEAALRNLGATLHDVVRTRIYATHIDRDWQAIGTANAEFLGDTRPATSMVQVQRLIEPWMLVEIEADAVLGATSVETRTVSSP